MPSFENIYTSSHRLFSPIQLQCITDYIDDAFEKALIIRKTLHQTPEAGNQEYKTTKIIEDVLAKERIGYKRLLNTGTIGYIKSSSAYNENPQNLAFRADIDALPLSNPKGKFTHSCGHDVHTSIVLGAAIVLNKLISNEFNINKNFTFIFQPDEEGDGGALPLLQKGFLDDFGPIDSIVGLHIRPSLLAGTIGIKHNSVHGASIMFTLHLYGKESHGATPEKGSDPISAAAQIISAVQTIVSRNISPTSMGLISFGNINGGNAPNTIAAQITLEGIIRGENDDICKFLKSRLNEICKFVGKAMGVKTILKCKKGYPALINNDKILHEIETSIQHYNCSMATLKNYSKESEIKLETLEKPSLTVDDFSYFLNEISGAYLFLGSGFPDRQNPELHTPQLMVNEDCLRTGIAALVAISLFI